ncbi:MAG: RHS repeat-associated core domain-containing protein [bacterium]
MARWQDNTNDVEYYLNDHLGTAVAIVDNSGMLRNWSQFRAYGVEHASSKNMPNWYEYTGKQHEDELDYDLNYFGARYYDPDLRRFISVDPLASKYPDWSPYAYALDNPIRYIDPDGRMPEQDWTLWRKGGTRAGQDLNVKNVNVKIIIGPQAPGGKLGKVAVKKAVFGVTVDAHGDFGVDASLEFGAAGVTAGATADVTQTSTTTSGDLPPVWWTHEEAMLYWYQEVSECQEIEVVVSLMRSLNGRLFDLVNSQVIQWPQWLVIWESARRIFGAGVRSWPSLVSRLFPGQVTFLRIRRSCVVCVVSWST